MRVIINQLSTLTSKTGIGHYTRELCRHLARLRNTDEVEVFPQGWLRWASKRWLRIRPSLEGGSAHAVTLSISHAVRRVGRECLNRQFRALCQKSRHAIYHEPNYLPFPTDLPTVVTVHDLSVLLHPQWHPPERVGDFERNFRRGVERCRHVLTDSDAVRREITQVLGIPAARVTRAYPGIRRHLGPLPADQTRAALRQLGLPPNYLLYVGTVEPRKNVLMLLRAYCSLPSSLRARCPLLLVGKWGWKADVTARYYQTAARHRGVRHLGYLPERRLPAVYNGARALVYPSYYEGFGLPPLEMMACGGAVLASTAEAVRETVGDHAHLLHPDDLDGWRQALKRLITDDDWWRSLRAGAEEVSRPYTWERCAIETLAVYRSLAGPPDAVTTPPTRAA